MKIKTGFKFILKNIQTILKWILPYHIFIYLKSDVLKMEQDHSYKKRVLFYKKFIKEQDLVFDLGANLGNRISVFLSLKAKVIAIEPQEKCIKYLKLKFGKKIKVIGKGVGSKNGIMNFYESDASTLSTFSEEWIESVKLSGRFSMFKWKKPKKIEVTTLDDLIEIYGKPCFVKIDVEGYEYEVLKGLSKSIQYISLEYALPENKPNLINCIEKLYLINNNVKFSYSIADSMELAINYWLDKDKMLALISTEEFEKTSCGDIYVWNSL